ncbi:MAG: AraC family transcriptional regulator [Eubacteriales bacterium]|nr:AraC family transcriptional regulator [Eubacteriales bacterium]
MNKITVWEQLDKECGKTNVDLIVSAEECKVMKIANETGEGIMSMYEIFPGIYLMYNDFHMESYASEFQHADTLLAIDHCREGRIEMEGDNSYYYLEQGDLLIDTRVHHKGAVHFPLSHYHGITIAFQPEFAEKALRELMPSLEIDLTELVNKFCKNDQPYVVRTDPSIENLFSQLYRIPKKSRKDYFRIKILELLVYLRDLDFEGHRADKVYFYKNQVEKIRAIHELITKDLTKNYTQEQLAKQFSIGITQMKQCFRSVYGQSMYSYLKTYRMNKAAELLIMNEKLKVMEIANACGYESVAKFGQAFKTQFGIPPLEYRKCNGRKEING